MDPLTFALQQARAASFQNLSIQAVSQFATVVDVVDNDDWKKRGKSMLHLRLHWAQFVLKNKCKPLFCCHLRMTHKSFVILLDKIRPHLPVPDEQMGALRGGIVIPEL
jgi:hypothetical protein